MKNIKRLMNCAFYSLLIMGLVTGCNHSNSSKRNPVIEPDTTPPTVSYVTPENAETDVPTNRKITATFSEAMDPLTITTTSFIVMQGITPVAGTVTYTGTVATFTPTSILSPNSLFTASVLATAKDAAGNQMGSDYVWTFTTGAFSDTIAPAVSSTIPLNDAIEVSVNSAMAIIFTEEMDPLTINEATFTVKKGTTSVLGEVTYVGVTATFTPDNNLSANSVYTATILIGAEDLAGNALENSYIWTFTTGDEIDETAPTVSSTIPSNSATAVAVNSAMAATFNETMDPLTITTTTFTVKQGTTPVVGVVTYVGVTATFTPSTALVASVVYTATISTGAKDLAGNALAVNKVWTFTTGAAPDTVAPTVSSTVPVNSATGVAVNSAMAATFSEAMKPLTITTTTFTVKQGIVAVPGVVSYTGVTATFTPSSSLSYSSDYTATITTGAKDLAGNALAVNKVWTFTTGTAPDTIAPTVSSTIPANSAVNVSVNSAMAATFSEAMTPLTITTTTFTVKQGVTPVAGAVTYAGVTATFTPASNLSYNSEYTATITSGAKDLAGNALETNKVWIFTTGAAPDTTAPTVSSTAPVNSDIDVAINSAIAATFSEAMDPLTITTTTFTVKHGIISVVGDVTYAGVTATFTPESSLAVSTLYTATITTGAKDLAGNALEEVKVWSFTTGAAPDTTAPMVSSTVPVNAATGVAVNSAMAATFSEAMDPLTISTTTFTLKKGTIGVTGAVTYAGVTATFTPASNLDYSTVYTATITTGAKDLAGNALAANKVWTFTTGSAPDTTAPMVSSTVPVNNATGVAVNSAMAATFSESMDPLTISTTTFTIKKGLIAVTGAVTYAGVTATFTPASNLDYSSVYTATITTGAKDLAGNALAVNKVWTFTTGAAPDTTAPMVSSTAPVNNATNVAVNSAMAATFSEAMNPLTITTVTFTVKQGITDVTGSVTYAGVTATFTPSSNLAYSTIYTATITTGAKDLAGNALEANKVWTFTTGAAPDTTDPMVNSTVPNNSATNVAVNSAMAATFTEAMDPLTITTTTFTMKKGIVVITGAVTYAGVTATFTPASNLDYSSTYTATITTGVKDLAGNALAVNKVWTFTTGAAPDTTAPTVISTIPLNAATDVAINSAVTATFSEAMDPLTITTLSFTVKDGTTSVSGAVTNSGVTATFTPTSNLTASTLFTATITTGAKDLAGNALAVNKVWTFTTGATPDTTAPTVDSVNPLDLATDATNDQIITAVFSEGMDPLTITTMTFTLKHGTTPVAGSVTYSGLTATFTPADSLAPSTLYTVTITTGAKDLAGNELFEDEVWTFTTEAFVHPVALGSLSNFAIIAGYAITTVPASNITGDVGISPAAESFITGFSQTAYTGYSLSPQITGFIYAADMASPTPALLTEAKGDLTIAYNDAAGRTPVPTGDFLNVGAGNLAGLTLVPGLYKFTGEVIATTDFTLTGNQYDVWVFQIATTLTVSNGVKVTLAGGAKAKNVFWQVGTQATLGTTVNFSGTIIADASITMDTGATLNGRALAFTGTVALDQNVIVVPEP